MVFALNVKEFFVNAINSNDEETVGIIDINGKIIVSPKNYSSIQVLSDNLGLYLVYKDEKYGVLNRQGDIIIHCEYDSIGIPDELLKKFNFSIDKSKYLLFDNTIIVKKDDKYGIFDTEGNQKFPTAFVGLGYTTETDSSSAGNSDDILTIEIDNLKFTDGSTKNIKGIIVQQLLNDTIKYGVYETECKKLILPCVYDRIYSKTSGGKTDYYIEIQDETNKLDEQIAKYPEDFN